MRATKVTTRLHTWPSNLQNACGLVLSVYISPI